MLTMNQRTTIRRPLRAVAFLAGAALLASCGASDASGVAIDDGWARTSPTSATVGVVYATITSDTDDELLSVSVDSSVAAGAEIHEMVPVDGSSVDHEAMHEDMHGDDGPADLDHDEMDESIDHDEMADLRSIEQLIRRRIEVAETESDLLLAAPAASGPRRSDHDRSSKRSSSTTPRRRRRRSRSARPRQSAA